MQNSFVEYAPTGETPQRVQYIYPNVLPRTEPHQKLLAGGSKSLTAPDISDLIEGNISPSKSIVYTDAQDDDVALVRPSSMDGGLREINVNVSTAVSRKSEQLMNGQQEIEFPNLSSSLMGPPPLKRHATMESKLPHKLGKGAVVRPEGRENVLLGTGRRLRSSPQG